MYTTSLKYYIIILYYYIIILLYHIIILSYYYIIILYYHIILYCHFFFDFGFLALFFFDKFFDYVFDIFLEAFFDNFKFFYKDDFDSFLTFLASFLPFDTFYPPTAKFLRSALSHPLSHFKLFLTELLIYNL